MSRSEAVASGTEGERDGDVHPILLLADGGAQTGTP